MILQLLIPCLISIILFLIGMYILRVLNFDKKLNRKDDWRKLTPELLSQQVEYHNNATYKAFEFYMKILLALIGGIGFVAIHKSENIKNSRLLLETGGYLIYPVTLIFIALIIVHQKSKIERWEKGYKWYAPIFWNECWFVSVSISIAYFINYQTIPWLIQNIN